MRQVQTHTVCGLTVEIASDGIWFTVYDDKERIVGTIERPHRNVVGWQAYDLDGDRVASTIGPRTALQRIYQAMGTKVRTA